MNVNREHILSNNATTIISDINKSVHHRFSTFVIIKKILKIPKG